MLSEREVEGTYHLSVAWQRKARLHRTPPPFLNVGRLVRYRMADIEQFLSEHVVPARKAQVRKARAQPASKAGFRLAPVLKARVRPAESSAGGGE